MKNRVLAVLVAAALLVSASGSTLAAGKLGGASGADEFRSVCPALAGGKLGGASGADEFASSGPGGSESGEGSGMDRCDQSFLSSGSL
jgi:hypothetical protein